MRQIFVHPTVAFILGAVAAHGRAMLQISDMWVMRQWRGLRRDYTVSPQQAALFVRMYKCRGRGCTVQLQEIWREAGILGTPAGESMEKVNFQVFEEFFLHMCVAIRGPEGSLRCTCWLFLIGGMGVGWGGGGGDGRASPAPRFPQGCSFRCDEW